MSHFVRFFGAIHKKWLEATASDPKAWAKKVVSASACGITKMHNKYGLALWCSPTSKQSAHHQLDKFRILLFATFASTNNNVHTTLSNSLGFWIRSRTFHHFDGLFICVLCAMCFCPSIDATVVVARGLDHLQHY